VLSVFGTTNRCFENHTAKNGLFLQFFQPDLDFTVEDEFETSLEACLLSESSSSCA